MQAQAYSANQYAEVQDISELVNKTVFLKVRFGTLGNSRKVGNDILETDADKELLKVSKTLLDSEELEAVRKADGKMRQYLYNLCLPYDIGVMLLPTGLVTQVEEKLKEFKGKRNELVNKFVSAYPSLCANAADRLGSLYRIHEYPSADHVKAKFIFDWQYVSFGVPGQLKGISADIFEQQKQKAEEVMQNAASEITLLMRQTMLDMVSHLKDRLIPGEDGKPKILRESAVNNLKEFLNTFELRNVTNDTELAAIVAKCKGLMGNTSAESLRESDNFKASIASQMSDIAASLGDMVEEKAGRKFREE